MKFFFDRSQFKIVSKQKSDWTEGKTERDEKTYTVSNS